MTLVERVLAHLPDLDGREVLERLKADPAPADIPVVVLSGA